MSFRDVVKFRSEVDTNINNYTSLPFFIKVELYWLPPLSILTEEQLSAKDLDNYINQCDCGDYVMVQSRVIQLNKSMMGLNTIVPVHFDHEFTCLTSFSVFTSIVEFKYRPRATGPLSQYLEQGIKVTKFSGLQDLGELGPEDIEQAVAAVKFHQFLFDNVLEQDVPEQISRVLNEVTEILVEIHHKIRKMFTSMVVKVIAADEVDNIQF